MNKLKRREIIKRLDRLPFEIQIKILDLAEAAAPTPQKGVSGKKLLRFAGILKADDAADMTQAIENESIRTGIKSWRKHPVFKEMDDAVEIVKWVRGKK